VQTETQSNEIDNSLVAITDMMKKTQEAEFATRLE